MTSPPVPVLSQQVREGRWVHVGERNSGANVYRVESERGYYVKATPPRDQDDPRFNPASEAARLRWLAGCGLPVSEPVEVGGNADLQWLVTTALPGRPASEMWSPADRPAVVDVIADLARAIHALPTSECPFDRGLTVLLAQANASVRTGAIDVGDFNDSHLGWTAQQLLDKLNRSPRPAEEEVVVCHGDLSLDNILIDPETLSLAGVIDVGRLGTADRWLDLSVVLDDIGDCVSWGAPELADRFLGRYGLAEVDGRRAAFYRLIDEFM